ncbi:hypothetical protein [Nocardiopsis sp. RV163]|uniref:hypothetical protein n=1 Tax=Nocardiopsis sp. RV163 TaxID=1661388 RepID=UPI00064BBEC8|nr:hypothetical protein [Nocardiopsis sp. RV163]
MGAHLGSSASTDPAARCADGTDHGEDSWAARERLLNTRHHLDRVQSTEAGWRARWEAARFLLCADGESGKRYGDETILITPDVRASIRSPAPLARLADAPHGR